MIKVTGDGLFVFASFAPSVLPSVLSVPSVVQT